MGAIIDKYGGIIIGVLVYVSLKMTILEPAIAEVNNPKLLLST